MEKSRFEILLTLNEPLNPAQNLEANRFKFDTNPKHTPVSLIYYLKPNFLLFPSLDLTIRMSGEEENEDLISANSALCYTTHCRGAH